jgi:hypothetical protein
MEAGGQHHAPADLFSVTNLRYLFEYGVWTFSGREKSLGPTRILGSTPTMPYRFLASSDMKVDRVCVWTAVSKPGNISEIPIVLLSNLEVG